MYDKIKPLLTIALLLFAGVTLAVQIAKELRPVEPLKLSEGLNVICTHATTRCPTCLTMERLTGELLDEEFSELVQSGRIVFREINYELPEANDFADEYKVATAAVVLVNIRNGKTVAGINLANEAWKLHTDAPEFKRMLREQIEAMLQGKVLEIDDSPEEMIFDDDEEIPLPF